MIKHEKSLNDTTGMPLLSEDTYWKLCWQLIWLASEVVMGIVVKVVMEVFSDEKVEEDLVWGGECDDGAGREGEVGLDMKVVVRDDLP